MKTISQNVEVAFVAPTLKDAMVMAPMMDAIVNELNNSKALADWNKFDWKVQRANRDAGVKVPNMVYFSWLPQEQLEHIYNVLKDCGFQAMVERKDFELKLVYHTKDELPNKEA